MKELEERIELINLLLSMISVEYEELIKGVRGKIEESYITEDALAKRIIDLENKKD